MLTPGPAAADRSAAANYPPEASQGQGTANLHSLFSETTADWRCHIIYSNDSGIRQLCCRITYINCKGNLARLPSFDPF